MLNYTGCVLFSSMVIIVNYYIFGNIAFVIPVRVKYPESSFAGQRKNAYFSIDRKYNYILNQLYSDGKKQ